MPACVICAGKVRSRLMLKRCGALLRSRGAFCRLGVPGLGLKAFAVAGLLIVGPVASAAAAVPSSAIVVDAKSGKVLFSSNPDSKRYPASLTKMMTLYLLFEAIENGKTSLDSKITVSALAANQAPSKLGLKPGQTISVRDAILAIVTKSANDVATAIGEHVGGTQKNFAARMTQRAHDLGMSRTTFRNANGLPDPAQVTTARDMATLGRALREHYPQYYSYFSTPSFVWHGRRISNHNRLLGRIAGVNGIKTGYTRASGYNLVTSVDRNNRMIVAVVLGGSTGKARDRRMASLIDDFLPKASRTRTARVIAGGPFIAAPENDAIAVAVSAAPPMPRPRPVDATEQTDTVIAAAGDPIDLKPGTDTKSVFANASVASVIGANSVFALDATDTEEGDTDAGDEVADVAPPARVIKGWRIQIAASPTQASAEEILDRALAKGAKILAHAAPYTEPVKSGSTTLYRARFAGFASKDAARDACTYLVKQKFSCLAVAN
jgi:D-alanyl-D-alanine carboxypeptidase